MNRSEMSIMLAAMSGYVFGDKSQRIPFAARTDGVIRSCNPSQHNTLRHDQVERKRKFSRRANKLKFKRYRRAT